MMTSRAEYRLLLRQDNADLRLTEIGHEIGLIDDKRYAAFTKKRQQIMDEIQRLESTMVGANSTIQKFLEDLGSTGLKTAASLAELIRRPELSYEAIEPIDEGRTKLPDDVIEQINITIKYQGYIDRQNQQVNQFKKLEKKSCRQILTIMIYQISESRPDRSCLSSDLKILDRRQEYQEFLRLIYQYCWCISR